MEVIDPVWLFGVIALVAGILIGAIVQKRFGPASGEVEKLQSELAQARIEKEEYQASVKRHFSKTSDLVNELTHDYVKVYRHLAEGAETLGNNPEFAHALQQSQGRVLISVEDKESGPAAQASVIEPGARDIPAAAVPATDPVDEGRVDLDHTVARDDGSDTARVEESGSERDRRSNPAPAADEGDTPVDAPEQVLHDDAPVKT